MATPGSSTGDAQALVTVSRATADELAKLNLADSAIDEAPKTAEASAPGSTTVTGGAPASVTAIPATVDELDKLYPPGSDLSLIAGGSDEVAAVDKGVAVDRMTLLQRLADGQFIFVDNKSTSVITVLLSPSQPLRVLTDREVAARGGAGPAGAKLGAAQRKAWKLVKARTCKVAVAPGDRQKYIATEPKYYISIQCHDDLKWHCLDFNVKRGYIVTVMGNAVLRDEDVLEGLRDENER